MLWWEGDVSCCSVSRRILLSRHRVWGLQCPARGMRWGQPTLPFWRRRHQNFLLVQKPQCLPLPQQSQMIKDFENPNVGFTLKTSLAACTHFKVAHSLDLFSQGAVSCVIEKCICTSLPSWAPPHPFLISALPLKHRNASVYIWSPLGVDSSKGEAKDVLLGATALRNGYLHLVIIIVFSNKTSGEKKISYSSKNGLNVFLFML